MNFLHELGKSRCILYFDELDKSCEKHGGNANEIMSILIHLTDKTTKNTFQDRFFQGIDFPLYNTIIIFSYNDPTVIDPILRSRFEEEIELKPYTILEKIEIAKKFVIPDTCKNIGFKVNQIKISDDNLEHIIDNYTSEGGVRDMKHRIKIILMELNMDRIYKLNSFAKGGFNKKITLNKDIITRILKKPPTLVKKIHTKDEVGVINGLFATESGNGGITPIQVYQTYVCTHNDEPGFFITGKQGDVMKESVKCAFTAALNFIQKHPEKFQIENVFDYVKDKFSSGFHIHTPSASVSKNGPSAGCAMTMAFLSRLTGKPIRHDIAITGEIDLRGVIGKIGGLVSKLPGGKKAGVKTVLLPSDNEKDIEEIKEKDKRLFEDFEVVLVSSVEEVVDRALIF